MLLHFGHCVRESKFVGRSRMSSMTCGSLYGSLYPFGSGITPHILLRVVVVTPLPSKFFPAVHVVRASSLMYAISSSDSGWWFGKYFSAEAAPTANKTARTFITATFSYQFHDTKWRKQKVKNRYGKVVRWLLEVASSHREQSGLVSNRFLISWLPHDPQIGHMTRSITNVIGIVMFLLEPFQSISRCALTAEALLPWRLGKVI